MGADRPEKVRVLVSDAAGHNIFAHHDHPRFAYISNLKAGYTSIITALLEHFPNVTAHDWERELDLPVVTKDYFLFSFVRHPVDRARSFYVDKLVAAPRRYQQEHGHSPQECQSIVFNAYTKFWDPSPRSGPVTDQEVFSCLERIGFAEFTYLLPLIATSDQHLYPQSAWLNKFPTLRPHLFIGRFERMDEDWQKVCQRLETDMELPHRNESDYSLPGARFHINDSWRRVIEQTYEPDMKEFYSV